MVINLDHWYIGIQISWCAVALPIGGSPVSRRHFPKYALVAGIMLTLALHMAEGGPGMILGPILYTLAFLTLEWLGRGCHMLLVLVGLLGRKERERP